MLIDQILIGGFDIFCYVLGDEQTGQGIIVDPGGPAQEILKRAKDRGREQDRSDRQHPCAR